MSVATLDPILDQVTTDRARRMNVGHLLGTVEQPIVLAWMDNAVGDLSKPVRVDIEIAPYAGSADVVWLDGTQPVEAPQKPAEAPVATVHQITPTPLAVAAVKPSLAWHQRFTKVLLTTLQNHTPEDGVLIARLLHFVSITGDLCMKVSQLEAITGIKRRSLRVALDRIADTISIRLKADGSQDVYIDDDGQTCWRLDVHHTINEGTRYVGVPLSWILTDEVDGLVKATTYASTTIWAAIITHQWLRGQGRAVVSIQQLMTLGRCSSKKFSDWWAKAEDAGLVSAVRPEFGDAATRSTHPRPITCTTSATRAPSPKKERHEPVTDVVDDEAVEPPF